MTPTIIMTPNIWFHPIMDNTVVLFCILFAILIVNTEPEHYPHYVQKERQLQSGCRINRYLPYIYTYKYICGNTIDYTLVFTLH